MSKALTDLLAKVEAGKWSQKLPPKGVYGLKSAKRLRLAFAAYNGSLDAALALHEALLPGWFASCGSWGSLPEDGEAEYLRGGYLTLVSVGDLKATANIHNRHRILSAFGITEGET